MNFIERLSSIWGKQYLFKQGKNDYYNRYIGQYQTKEEAQEWLISQFEDDENELKTMKLTGVYCKKCKNIIYSRSNHDFRRCDCSEVAVDGGFELFRCIFTNIEDHITIKLDGEILLEQILHYDWNYKNSNAEEYKEGFYGKFKLDKQSSKSFYEKLITKGFDEVWSDLHDV